MTTENPLISILAGYEARLGTPWSLTGDMVIVGDTHIPYTDYVFAERVTMIGKRHLRKPRKLLLAGDFFSLDNFSHYLAVVTPPTWAEEREYARNLIHYWRDVFDEIWMLMGNHERRLQKWTEGAFEEKDLLALITTSDKVQMSNRGWCTVEGAGRTWRVTHSKNYSVNQLTVADQLAWKFEANIISFHEHHLSKGFDRFGNHVIVNGGCLVDPNKLAWVVLDDSKAAGMKKGFVLFKNGSAEPLGEAPFTDWSKWL